MKKKVIIPLLISLVLILVLFLPISKASYDDGGTREYCALTYKIVIWNKIVPQYDENGEFISHELYNKTSVFWYPDSKKNIDELWQEEISNISHSDVVFESSIAQLKQKYPEYFDLDTFKGLEVYVWQESPDFYRCGVVDGTNRHKTTEEILSLMENGATIGEMKTILSLYEIEKTSVLIFPVTNPISSHWIEIDEKYRTNIEKMFWEY